MARNVLNYRPQLWALFSACVLLFVWAAYATRSHTITGKELSIFRTINNWPNSLRLPFLVITQFGSAWMLYGMTLLLLFIKQHRLGLRVFVTGAVTYVLAESAKLMIGRPRPGLILAAVHKREGVITGNGFPSGHTALAAAISLVLVIILPARYKWLPVVWIGLVGLSRIYLGVHGPYDLVGGFAIGAGVVCASMLIRGKLKFVTKVTHLQLTD